MKKIQRLVFLVCLLGMMAAPVLGLDALYERNGLVYLLVSDDNQTQEALDGVYQANRTPTGFPLKLYYPGLTYGLGVDLNLWLYTFSELKDNLPTAYTGPQEKVVNYKQTRGYYTGAAWWHRCINQVNGSTRIGGSEGHFPCEDSLNPVGSWGIISNSVDGDSELKLVKIPAGKWYHCRDAAAIGWSNHGDGTGGGWYAPHETNPHPYQDPNPLFPGARSWKMYSDVEKRLYHKYYKHTWKTGMPATQPPAGPKVAESYDVDITRYIRNGCFDGCGINQSQVPLPAEKWHTSQVFNRLAKSYFYARKINTSLPTNEAYLDIEGVRHTTYPVIGLMNDPSAEDVGVSMKSATDDFVYVLGKKVAQNWLSLYYGAPITISYGRAVVSDQWWMKGGTVFVYDRNTGVIYQIERDEYAATEKDKIAKIVTHTGVGNDVNDIGTDGFGNVYYTKTSQDPAKSTDFLFTMPFPKKQSVTWGNPSGNIRGGIVKYRQNLYKTVYKKDIYGTKTTEGELQIGYRDYDQNIQYTPWTVTSDMNDVNFWKKLGDPYLVYSSIGNASRTEMAVVNVATPPNVSGEKVAKLDISGPFGDNGSGFYQVPANPDNLTPYQTYKFEIENYPLHNGKINQRTSTDPAVDAQFRRINRHPFDPTNYVGGFVSTLKILGSNPNECVKYNWRIYQTVDAAANPILPPKLIYERGATADYYSPYIFASLDYGEYEVQVSAKYQWYDMDLLTYGATVASLPAVLKPGPGSYDMGKAVDNTDWAKLYLKVDATATDPQPIGNVVIYRNKPGTGWITSDANEGASIGTYFVTNDLRTENWKVEDPTAAQLVAAIRKEFPPNPNDVHMRPGTLKWTDDKVEVNWSAKLLNPQTPLTNGVYYAPAGIPFIGKTKKQTLAAYPTNVTNLFNMMTGPTADDNQADQWRAPLNIPSDPCFYELRCTAERNFVWESVTYTFEQDPLGNLIPVPGPSVPRSSKVGFTGVTRVLVLDRTPPLVAEAIVTPKYLYAENNGTISGTVDGTIVNPNDVIIEVPDANPMGYLNWKRPEATVGTTTHSLGVQATAFWYEAAGANNQTIGTYPQAIVAADFTVVASAGRSLYRIRVPKTALTRSMPIHKAFHLKVPGTVGTNFGSSDVAFEPLQFGLSFLDDTSRVKALFPTNLGETHLIDVIRPNVIIGIADEKYSITRWIPDSSSFGLFTGYAWVSGNALTWAGDPPANLGSVNVNGTIVSPLFVRVDPAANPIEVDTPITFTLYARDNITPETGNTLTAFQLQKSLPVPAGAVEDISRPIHRRLFRMDTSGTRETWVVSGTVKDRAVGLPSQLQKPDDPATTFPLRERTRTIDRVPFEVHNTTLDVRIIEKNQR